MQKFLLFVIGAASVIFCGWGIRFNPSWGFGIIIGAIVMVLPFIDIDERPESEDPQSLG